AAALEDGMRGVGARTGGVGDAVVVDRTGGGAAAGDVGHGDGQTARAGEAGAVGGLVAEDVEGDLAARAGVADDDAGRVVLRLQAGDRRVHLAVAAARRGLHADAAA